MYLGISGSVKDEKMNKIARQLLNGTWDMWELVLLENLSIYECGDCSRCMHKPHICEMEDGFPELSKRMMDSQGLVLCYPSEDEDANTKLMNLYNRVMPFIHSKSLRNRGSILITKKGHEGVLEGYAEKTGLYVSSTFYIDEGIC